jgi:general secretion pathway protein A
MYLSHFGLREPPFAMTPDPRFLYLSERHREALAHLLYGVSEHGGFVQLTGEVGTGKTSVCRCLLEQLPAEVDVALILNPRLSPAELLAAICDELAVAHPGGGSVKALVDALHRHLLEAHARGRRTVLIVDEAQNLAPGVLEQVRLLTNLETSQDKLLQVILIGQPELAALLARPKLRQVAQRITARYHLEPLSASETRAYVRHRVAVAGGPEELFTGGALRLVRWGSHGIPRLINAIADRALLGAYARGRQRVGALTVHRASREILGAAPPARAARWRRRVAAAAAAGGAVALVLVTPAWVARSVLEPLPAAVSRGPTAAVVPAATTGAAPGTAPGPGAAAPGRLDELLRAPGVSAGRRDALAVLFAQWGQGADGSRADCWVPGPGGLECVASAGTWRKLRRLDLPAAIELAGPDGARRYAAVTALSGTDVTLRFGDRTLTVPIGEVDPLWDGRFVVIWRPPAAPMPVQLGDRGPSVAWVRERLARVDGEAAAGSGTAAFDQGLRARLVRFQRTQGLEPDGIVGWETAIVLQNASGGRGAPRLSQPAPQES